MQRPNPTNETPLISVRGDHGAAWLSTALTGVVFVGDLLMGSAFLATGVAIIVSCLAWIHAFARQVVLTDRRLIQRSLLRRRSLSLAWVQEVHVTEGARGTTLVVRPAAPLNARPIRIANVHDGEWVAASILGASQQAGGRPTITVPLT